VSEKDLQNACIKYLSMLPDSLCYECYNGGVPITARGSRIIYKRKNTLNRPNGFPDVLWFVRGETIMLEFKLPKGRLTEDQAAMHKHLNRIGFDVYVIRSLSELMVLVDDVYRKE